MDIDTRCPDCWRLDEDGGHCFLESKQVKYCWSGLNLEGDQLALSNLSSSYNVTEDILKMPNEKMLLIVGLLRSWWDARNKSNAGDGMRSIEEVIFRARSLTQIAQQEEDMAEARWLRGQMI